MSRGRGGEGEEEELMDYTCTDIPQWPCQGRCHGYQQKRASTCAGVFRQLEREREGGGRGDNETY